MVGISPDDPNLPVSIGFAFNKPVAHFVTPLSEGSNYTSKTNAKRDFGIFSITVALDAQYRVK